jgi:hypothetical protein
VGTAQFMKQILCVLACAGSLLLAGCSANSSVLGNKIAGIGGAAKSWTPQNTQTNALANGAEEPVSTGSIVPLSAEGAVVDLPDAGSRADNQASDDQVKLSSSSQEGATDIDGMAQGQQDVEPEQPLSAEERHRRELINRGDLQEGEALPVE